MSEVDTASRLEVYVPVLPVLKGGCNLLMLRGLGCRYSFNPHSPLSRHLLYCEPFSRCPTRNRQLELAAYIQTLNLKFKRTLNPKYKNSRNPETPKP